MRRSWLLLLCVLGLVAALSPAAAAPELPFITGGGRAENNNSGGDPQNSFGGFVARATGEGQTQSSPFQGDITVYPAEGEVQARSATVADNQTVIKVHGEPVCIANYGPSSGVDGGGNPDEDVWEIRFQIERSTPPGLEGFYTSVFVQDNGRDDFIDENAEQGLLTNPNCGEATQFQLEPLRGQITVHD